jgi:hypothetical protein
MPAMRLRGTSRRKRADTVTAPVAPDRGGPAADARPSVAPPTVEIIAPESPVAPIELSTLAADSRAVLPVDDAAEAGDVETRQDSKPDLRGLSKKQRRRVLQEIRDRERAVER